MQSKYKKMLIFIILLIGLSFATLFEILPYNKANKAFDEFDEEFEIESSSVGTCINIFSNIFHPRLFRVYIKDDTLLFYFVYTKGGCNIGENATINITQTEINLNFQPQDKCFDCPVIFENIGYISNIPSGVYSFNIYSGENLYKTTQVRI